jgi:hypothetical protein
MRGLLLASIILISAFFGYQEFLNWQEQAAAEQQARLKFKQEQAALDAARASNNINLLNQFIFDHPDSQWLERAVFYRDQMAYREAVAEKTPKALQGFITTYPNSQWAPQAEQGIQRLNNEFRLQQEMVKQEARLKEQRQQLAGQGNRGTARSASGRDPLELQVQGQRQARQTSSQDRVSRALAIYQQQRDQEKKQSFQQQQQRAAEQERQRRCNEISDQLRQYQRNRVRWYELDENGERVFLSDDQIESSKREMQQYREKHCS